MTLPFGIPAGRLAIHRTAVSYTHLEITEEGLYQVMYGDAASPVFRIAKDVWDKGIWPVSYTHLHGDLSPMYLLPDTVRWIARRPAGMPNGNVMRY